ncbi:glutamine ABC transporter, glutamine-binding periplasmic protein [Fischerella sp. NIES-4106]|nr:glutamine ABC transporter, glutamine-binding periplasmic protein [Fischerella sp. NIES-4106]
MAWKFDSLLSGLAIAVRTENKDITSFNTLGNKKIAVEIGTTRADKAKSVPGATIREFKSVPLALQDFEVLHCQYGSVKNFSS